jgi:hypothetical protein
MATPTGPQANQITSDAHRVAVEIDVSELVGRLEREALRLVNDLTQQGLSGDDLARAVSDGLRELSDVPIDRAARGAVGEAFNLGRNLEAQRRLTDIARVTRSEILDENTCAYCREVDGATAEINTERYFELMPPNGCAGREQCRGFYIYEAAA